MSAEVPEVVISSDIRQIQKTMQEHREQKEGLNILSGVKPMSQQADQNKNEKKI